MQKIWQYEEGHVHLRVEVLTRILLMMQVFWNIMLCHWLS